jgi:hypothetical protein
VSEASHPVPLAVPAFVITGAGEWGRAMCSRLLQARDHGRLDVGRIVLVDRDDSCASRLPPDPAVVFERDTWDAWLDRELVAQPAGAHLVPYHWAPHLLSGWLSRQLEADGATVSSAGVPPALGTPYESETPAGDRVLSYATWPCPPSCIEPELCPHTRGPRDWSLTGRLRSAPERVSFPCLHLVWGVGTIPLQDVLAAREALRARVRRGEAFEVEVGTASHCHGLLARLRVTPS